MGIILAMIVLGGTIGYLIATKRKGNYLDKLQYIAVFSVISLIAAIIMQIIIMKLILI
tara:strand:- start:85 stop:258 length:174 start_codon:yes stop_codon:yes gene_type:complete